MKLHLVDGTFELFRAFYGAPSALSPQGVEVGATRSLLRSLTNLLQQPAVTHVAVAFDTVIESFRNELFAGYKSSDGIEPALYSQFSLAEEAAAALGLVVWPMVEFETDDAIATAAARWRDQVEQVVICSPDKDFAQCVCGDRVILWDRLRDRFYDEAAIREKFGVSPASIPDWLALVGDQADGIPGVARWGAKGAATVLAHYGHIEAIPDDPRRWDVHVRGAATLAANLHQSRTDALLYRRLAVLRTDVPLAETLADLLWRGAPRAAMTAFCDRLGDSTFVRRVPRWLDAS